MVVWDRGTFRKDPLSPLGGVDGLILSSAVTNIRIATKCSLD